jgi:glucosamine-6-phosphate isomerase
MKIRKFETYQAMCSSIADILVNCVKAKADALLCLAAGHTSLGVFEEMIRRQNAGMASFRRCVFFGMDEWGGVGKGNEGSMVEFMYKNLFYPAGIADEKIVFFDGNANLEDECTRMNRYLKMNGPLDFVLLGSGMNGHLGLNEPGCSFSSTCHVANLTEQTRKVARESFHLSVPIDQGVTIGIQNIKDAKQALLMINGEHKAGILKQILQSGPTNTIPATFLKTLDHAALFYDSLADAPSGL